MAVIITVSLPLHYALIAADQIRIVTKYNIAHKSLPEPDYDLRPSYVWPVGGQTIFAFGRHSKNVEVHYNAVEGSSFVVLDENSLFVSNHDSDVTTLNDGFSEESSVQPPIPQSAGQWDDFDTAPQSTNQWGENHAQLSAEQAANGANTDDWSQPSASVDQNVDDGSPLGAPDSQNSVDNSVVFSPVELDLTVGDVPGGDQLLGVHGTIRSKAEKMAASIMRDESGMRKSSYESAKINAVVRINGRYIAKYRKAYCAHLGNIKSTGPRTTLTLRNGQFTPPILELLHSVYYDDDLYTNATTYIPLSRIITKPTVQTLSVEDARELLALPDFHPRDRGNGKIQCAAHRISFTMNGSDARHVVKHHQRQIMQKILDPEIMLEDQNLYERRLDALMRLVDDMDVDIWISSKSLLLQYFIDTLQENWVRAKSNTLFPLFAASPKKWKINFGNFATPDMLDLTSPEPVVTFFSSIQHATAVRLYMPLYEQLLDNRKATELNQATSQVFMIPIPNTKVGQPGRERTREFLLVVESSEAMDILPGPGQKLDVVFAGEFRIPCSARVIESPHDLSSLGDVFMKVTLPFHPYWDKDDPHRPLVNYSFPYLVGNYPRVADLTYELLRNSKKYLIECQFTRSVEDGTARAHIFAASKFAEAADGTPFGRFAQWTVDFHQGTEVHQVSEAFPMFSALRERLAYLYSAQQEAEDLMRMARDCFDFTTTGRPSHPPAPPAGVDQGVFDRIWSYVDKLDEFQRAAFLNYDRANHSLQILLGGPGSGKTGTGLLELISMQAQETDIADLHRFNRVPNIEELEIDDETVDLVETERMSKNAGFYFKDRDAENNLETGRWGRVSFAPLPKEPGEGGTDSETSKSKDNAVEDGYEWCAQRRIPKPEIAHPRAFIVATSNRQADDIANRYSELVESVGLGLRVIRLTPFEREKNDIRRRDKPFEADFEDMEGILEYMESKKRLCDIREQANNAQARLNRGGETDASEVAWHLLLSDTNSYPDFEELHEAQFTDPEGFSENSKTYSEWVVDALRRAIGMAHTIIGTSYAAYKLWTQEIWTAEIIFHDEAGRATESETLTAWACFPDAYVRIMAGDYKQSETVSFSATSHMGRDSQRFVAPFGLQTTYPFIQRADDAGIDCITWLRYNHRTRMGLGDFGSKRFYNNAMNQYRTDPITSDEQRALDWLHSKNPGMVGARLFIDVDGRTESKDVSTKNVAHANLIAMLAVEVNLQKLSIDGKRIDILILTPYKDQVTCIKHAIARLSPQEVCKERVDVRTVWDGTGHQGGLVIFDTTRSSQPGLTGKPRIVNVATSRSSCIEIVIGNCNIFKKKPSSDPSVKHLHALYKDCQKSGAVLLMDGEKLEYLCRRCYQGQHKNEEKCGFTPICKHCPSGADRHHLRNCPQLRDHKPLEANIGDDTTPDHEIVLAPIDNFVVRGKRAYKGFTRASYNMAHRRPTE
ncbi:hypothetical protein DL771_004795 [Monosporascus sp. 5C6A]|nr:hypothetical protein DL771_004795 [Monosporascus sp. 5C6A]